MFDLSIHNISDIHQFIESNNVLYLEAVSVGSVFFGALTYIGNGPNFMVKAIAEQQGVKMPGFFQYIAKYSIPVLLPILVVVWLLFFAF
jgi:Na+/H+ antiporter NhaD/arsenite permease-like protein